MKKSTKITFNGLLITLEGIDGSGKSTLAKSLHAALKKNNIPVILTREPGGSDLGKHLRVMLQERLVPLCPKAEYLLFAADRAQHMHDVIIPNLQEHMIIISDRMADSSLVYQGYGRGLDLDFIEMVNAWSMNGIKPQLTFYLKISPEQARKRLEIRSEKLTIFEQEIDSFRERLVKGFETVFAKRTNVITLDAMLPIEELTQKALDALIPLLKQ
jgi:dTMP kinase